MSFIVVFIVLEVFIFLFGGEVKYLSFFSLMILGKYLDKDMLVKVKYSLISLEFLIVFYF